MNWDAIGAIGEVLGAIAVILTLVYLAAQIRQSSAAQHSHTSWSITQTLDGLNARTAASGELTEIWLRGCRDLASLDEVERERFRTLAMGLLNLAIYVHAHPTEEHQFYNRHLAGVVANSPGLRAVLDDVREYTPEDLYVQLTSASTA